ncbi:MAG: GLPGLI family protein [Muribaculaceae bacterium]|nr:GLPGLI family protein [Muribaculaceae bacterium]
MNRLFIFLIICLIPFVSFAQTDMLKLSYEEYSKIYKDKSKSRVAKYILQTDFNNSVYYNPNTYFLDKSAHDDAARNAYGAMASALLEKGEGASVPNRTISTYVFKYADSQNKRVYDDAMEEYIYYDEPFEEMQWNIIPDSTKSVLGYECLKAECNYHGKDWNAWFTPEIPVSDGPWKFAGLPGLILYVSDSNGYNTFVATGLEYTKDELPQMEVPEYYHKGNRIEFLRLVRKLSQRFSVDALLEQYQIQSQDVKIYTSDGRELTSEMIREEQDLLDPNYEELETDY